MKTIINIVVLILSFSYVGNCQFIEKEKVSTSQVPANVISEFNKNYKAVENVEWFEYGSVNFLVYFKKDCDNYIILYDYDGKAKKIKKEICINNLSKEIKEKVFSFYSNAEIQKAYNVEIIDQEKLLEIHVFDMDSDRDIVMELREPQTETKL